MATTEHREADEPIEAPPSASRPGSAGSQARAGLERRGGLGTVGAILRGLLGALTLVGGLTWLLLNLHGPQAATDVLVGAVLAAGGLVLLMPHRIRLPRVLGTAGMTVAALVGTAAGLAYGKAEVCCAYAYLASRGWPFLWVHRGAVAENPDTARNLALAADWQIDLVAVVGNLLFWAYAGMLIVVAVTLVNRARARARAV